MQPSKEEQITKTALQAFKDSMEVIIKRLDDVDVKDRIPALIITLSIFESKLNTLTKSMPIFKAFREATLRTYKTRDLEGFKTNVMPFAPDELKPKKDK